MRPGGALEGAGSHGEAENMLHALRSLALTTQRACAGL